MNGHQKQMIYGKSEAYDGPEEMRTMDGWMVGVEWGGLEWIQQAYSYRGQVDLEPTRVNTRTGLVPDTHT